MDLPAARQHRNLLFDFYGALLTERQREVFSMHHMEDCSLAEIGAGIGVTPQAVADLLKRSLGRLNRYEAKLGLVAKYAAHRDTINELHNALAELEDSAPVTRIRELVDTLSM